jgi:ribosomal protein S6--L-glutamate ligase
VGLLVERRYRSQAQPTGLAAELRRRGCRVRVIDPEASAHRIGDDRWLVGLDLIVARGRSWGLLCMLSWAEARGVPTINHRASIGAVHNKAEMAVVMAVAGVPMPRPYLGPAGQLGAGRGRSRRGAPLVLKPMFGDNGNGLRVVRDETELAGLDWPEPAALAQEFVSAGGRERKLYGIGDRVWAVERSAALGDGATPADARAREVSSPQAVAASPAERALAIHCRRLFGLDLYGLDCLPSPGGPVVIEVNEFPNYTGVPQASEHLAEFVLRSAANAGEPVRSMDPGHAARERVGVRGTRRSRVRKGRP